MLGDDAHDQAVYFKAVAVDRFGNSYITGFGDGVLNDKPLVGHFDALVSSYDSAGRIRFVRTWGTKGDDRGYGIAVDSEQNIFACGVSKTTNSWNEFRASGYNNPEKLLRVASFPEKVSAFAIKFDRDAKQQFQIQMPGQQHANRVLADQHGNFYLGGYLMLTKHLGSNGDEIWRDNLPSNYGRIMGLGLDKHERSVVCGSMAVPNTGQEEEHQSDGFVVRYLND